MPAAPPAQPSPAAFGLRPGPVTATAGASRQLSLSQAVVTTVPQASGTGVLSRDALRLLLDSAAGGDANAQLALAVRYANGEGVRQSYPEALKWFNQARAQGLAPRDGRPQEAWARVQQWAQSHPGKQ